MDRPLSTLQDKKSYLDLRRQERVTLLEILDRALDKGVVISGDVVISVAEVDLVYLGVKVLLSSVETMERLRGAPFPGAEEEPS
ncbi:MAG: gas vesicle protein [Candidatus Omnitrophota bacterium]